jgi:splicing suppressor protein 51
MGKACKERERLAKSGNGNVPTLPVGAIRGYLCFRCFEPSEKLNTCAGCQRARYCSKECQRLDWAAVHKKRCKVLRKVNDLQVQQYQDAFSWDEYSRNLVRLVSARKVLSVFGSNLV